MTYDEWVMEVPEVFRRDSLWKMEAYRLALFAGDIGWQDVCKLVQDARTRGLADQLYRSLGSMSANLAEGYSRGTGKDRARFYEYSLGSARESRDWYFKGRHILGTVVADHRINLLTQIIRLTLAMIPQQRGRTLRETPAVYKVTPPPPLNDIEITDLLNNIPFPKT